MIRKMNRKEGKGGKGGKKKINKSNWSFGLTENNTIYALSMNSFKSHDKNDNE